MAGHLLVTNDFPPKTGGIQAYQFELWRRLEAGRATVLTATSHSDAASFDSSVPMVVERVPASTMYLPTPRARAAVVAAIERHQPDLVLFDPAWPLGLLGPTLSRPYGVILHGAEVAVPGRLPLSAGSLRHVLRHASVAICAGAYPETEARRIAAEWMPPVVQVPPGVDTMRFAPLAPGRRDEVRRDLGLPEDAALVSSYSRLVPRKGMDTLIRASLFVQRAEPRLHVAIGGTGRDRERLEKMATALKAPVTFLGRIPDDRLGPLLAASDLMVMDCRSRWLGLEQEGFGIVFLEAAACGVAQVAGRSGGSHEAVRHGISGLVVADARSEQSLATAITKLLGDDERRRRYGSQAREIAVRYYEWDALAARLGEALVTFDHFETSNELA